MKRAANVVLPALVLVLGVGILQAHAWAWWAERITGAPLCLDAWPCWLPWRGWGVAVGLEALALWSWPRGGWQRWALGGTATALLVAGVLWQISAPAVAELTAQPPVARNPAIEAAEQAVQGEQAALDTLLADWRLRPQVPAQLGQVRAARAHLQELLAEQGAAELRARVNWRTVAGIAMQAAALVVLQVGVVLAMVHLVGGRSGGQHQAAAFKASPLNWMETHQAEARETGRGATETAHPETQAGGNRQSETTDTEPETGQEATQDYTELNDRVISVRQALVRLFPGRTWAQIAAETGTTRRDMSLVVNHERLTDSNARTVSAGVLDKLEMAAKAAQQGSTV
jgi:hypothetical protein